MSKETIRRELSITFLQGLREILQEDPNVDVVLVRIFRVENPDFSKTSSFKINFYK